MQKLQKGMDSDETLWSEDKRNVTRKQNEVVVPRERESDVHLTPRLIWLANQISILYLTQYGIS
jgi:hypothetical protein